MITDICCEQLVERKFSGADYLKCGGIVTGIMLLYIILSGLLIGFLSYSAFGIILMLFVCAVWLSVFLIKRRLIEYEYILVNGEFTVDKIFAKSTRRRVFAFDIKNIEAMGDYNAAEHKTRKYDLTCNYSELSSGEGAKYCTIRDPKRGLILLIFNPNERTRKAMKPYVNQLVFRQAFPGE